MKILRTNTNIYLVGINEDGTLSITYNGEVPINNPGMFINQMGGIEGVLARCEDGEYDLDGYRTYIKQGQKEKQRMHEERHKAAMERQARWNAEREDEYKALVAKYEGAAIPTTFENIGIILRYLNTMSWGAWRLPKMTIGYKCHQYDCDGKVASTMTLDKPIDVSCYEEGGLPEMVDKFQVGAPVRHLMQYHRC